LDKDKKLIPIGKIEAIEIMGKTRVGETTIGKYRISTVFLPDASGINLDQHYETMVFLGDGYSECYTRRYETWGLAEIGHKKIVEMVKKNGFHKEGH